MSFEISELQHVRNRIAALRNSGQDPLEIVLSPETWGRLIRNYLDFTPGLQPRNLAVRDVLGVRGRLVPGTQGCLIRYFGGVDFPPDQAVTDGFIDLANLHEYQSAGSDRRG